MSDKKSVTYCNSRLKGNGDTHEKREPGPEHAGDGYCEQTTSGGRCRMHGRDAGRPVKHGLTAGIRDDLREHVERALEMDAPGSLERELAVLRGLLYDYLDGKGELSREDISAAESLLKEIRRTIDVAHQKAMRERPTQSEIRRMTEHMGRILREYVPEDRRADALRELERLNEGEGAAKEPYGR